MKLFVFLLLLFRGVTFGQSVQNSFPATTHGQASATVKGINIKKSIFDFQTKNVELVFINDRAADITAYHYCLNIESTDPKISRRECELIDTLSAVLDWKAETKDSPETMVNTLADLCSMPECNVVRPGQERTIGKHVGYRGVFNATVVIDLVCWSDNTFDGEPAQLQALIAERLAQIQVHQFAASTIKDALANRSEATLVATAIQALRVEQARTPVVKISDNADDRATRKFAIGVVIDSLRKPESNRGNSAEYVPENQREFLNVRAKYHDYLAGELAKTISLQEVGDQ